MREVSSRLFANLATLIKSLMLLDLRTFHTFSAIIVAKERSHYDHAYLDIFYPWI